MKIALGIIFWAGYIGLIICWYRARQKRIRLMAEQDDVIGNHALERLERDRGPLLNNRGVAAVETAILMSILLIPTMGIFIDVPRLMFARSQLEQFADLSAQAGARDLGEWTMVDGLPTFTKNSGAAYGSAESTAAGSKIEGVPITIDLITVDEEQSKVHIELSYQFAPLLPIPALSLTLRSQADVIRAN